jgi:hypothetical protein
MVTPFRAVALGLALLVGCRMEPAPGWAAPSDRTPSTAPSSDPDEPAASGGRGGGAASRGGSGGGGTTGGSSAARGGGGTAPNGSGATAGAVPDDAASGGDDGVPAEEAPDGAVRTVCDAQLVSFDELRSGAVRLGARVAVDAVATSQKFLLSHASSGGCLFGAYVGVAPVESEPRGLLLVSYGEDARSDLPCPTGTDGIPDDLEPGDRVTAAGRYSSYAPSRCDAVAPSPQLLVDTACPLAVAAAGEPLDAVTLPFDVADALALGADEGLLRRYSGGLVRLEGVSGLANEEGTGIVGSYGVIRLVETRLPLTNDIGYGDLTLSGPADPNKSLSFPHPTTFASVTGVVHLDYCAWSLAPRDRCADLEPGSRGCP